MSAAYTQRLRLLLDAAISATRAIAEAHPAVRGLVGARLCDAQGAIADALAMQAAREPLPGDTNVGSHVDRPASGAGDVADAVPYRRQHDAHAGRVTAPKPQESPLFDLPPVVVGDETIPAPPPSFADEDSP